MDFTNLGNNMRVTLESMRSASGNYIAFGGLLDLRSYSLPRLQQLYDRLSQFRESAPATQSSERCQREGITERCQQMMLTDAFPISSGAACNGILVEHARIWLSFET